MTASTPADPQETQVSLSAVEIRQVLDALSTSDWDEAVVTVGEVTISVARNGAQLPGSAPLPAPAVPAAVPAVAAAPAAVGPVAAAAPAAAVPPPAADEGLVQVTAPSVGVFWRSPSPSAPAFVEVGQRVEKGDTVAIVELMKLMNNIAAPVSGVVTAVHVENAVAVEYGDVLVSVKPDPS